MNIILWLFCFGWFVGSPHSNATPSYKHQQLGNDFVGVQTSG